MDHFIVLRICLYTNLASHDSKNKQGLLFFFDIRDYSKHPVGSLVLDDTFSDIAFILFILPLSQIRHQTSRELSQDGLII